MWRFVVDFHASGLVGRALACWAQWREECVRAELLRRGRVGRALQGAIRDWSSFARKMRHRQFLHLKAYWQCMKRLVRGPFEWWRLLGAFCRRRKLFMESLLLRVSGALQMNAAVQQWKGFTAEMRGMNFYPSPYRAESRTRPLIDLASLGHPAQKGAAAPAVPAASVLGAARLPPRPPDSLTSEAIRSAVIPRARGAMLTPPPSPAPSLGGGGPRGVEAQGSLSSRSSSAAAMGSMSPWEFGDTGMHRDAGVNGRHHAKAGGKINGASGGAGAGRDREARASQRASSAPSRPAAHSPQGPVPAHGNQRLQYTRKNLLSCSATLATKVGGELAEQRRKVAVGEAPTTPRSARRAKRDGRPLPWG